uniref:Uncharacterized protein n=1 Tax=Physcomitrium patens TaxID=3218 RepID=A0A2K1K1N6_PHYPA|nr:hypothetical protein PHYPA_012154 [Physcomitrium patens]
MLCLKDEAKTTTTSNRPNAQSRETAGKWKMCQLSGVAHRKNAGPPLSLTCISYRKNHPHPLINKRTHSYAET